MSGPPACRSARMLKAPRGRVAARLARDVCSRWAVLESGLRSDHDALDFVDGDSVGRPVVELRRLRGRVPRDLLGVFEGTSI